MPGRSPAMGLTPESDKDPDPLPLPLCNFETPKKKNSESREMQKESINSKVSAAPKPPEVSLPPFPLRRTKPPLKTSQLMKEFEKKTFQTRKKRKGKTQNASVQGIPDLEECPQMQQPKKRRKHAPKQKSTTMKKMFPVVKRTKSKIKVGHTVALTRLWKDSSMNGKIGRVVQMNFCKGEFEYTVELENDETVTVKGFNVKIIKDEEAEILRWRDEIQLALSSVGFSAAPYWSTDAIIHQVQRIKLPMEKLRRCYGKKKSNVLDQKLRRPQKTIDNDIMKEIESVFGQVVLCPNRHVMQGPQLKNSAWCCDHSSKFGGEGCLSGMNSFKLKCAGISQYHCVQCDFDLCDKCGKEFRDVMKSNAKLDANYICMMCGKDKGSEGFITCECKTDCPTHGVHLDCIGRELHSPTGGWYCAFHLAEAHADLETDVLLSENFL